MLAARSGATSSTCQGRAPRRARAAPKAATRPASSLGGGSQSTRRTLSGETMFSTGMASRSDSSARAAREAASRAAAAGSLSAQARAGGGASVGTDCAGRALSGSRPLRSRACHQVRAARRAGPPRNPGSVSSSSIEATGVVAAATIAASGRIRPGETSRRWASCSRVCHSSRTTASWRRLRTRCMPDVRRQGSVRGGGGVKPGQGGELLLGPLQLALLAPAARARRRAGRPGPRRPARRTAARARAAGAWTSPPPSAPWPGGRPSSSSTTAARPTRGRPASRAPSSVSNSVRGRIPTSARHGRSWLAACSTHSASAMASDSSCRSGQPIGSIRKVPAPARRSWTRYARWP